MTSPNVTPSPKARFLSIKQCVDQHRELLQRPDFNLAIDNAMSQMMWNHSGGGEQSLHIDGNTAASRYYRLQGAQEFVRTLKTLAEVQAPLPPQDTGQIDHTFK